MENVKCKLTILFEEPFWIGVYERIYDKKYEACKITFGAEPKDYEVFDFMLKNLNNMKLSPAIRAQTVEERRINPKRQQRLINKQLSEIGIGTKAQQALKLQRDKGMLEKKQRSRKRKEEEQQRLFELKQEKRKKKHKGH